MKTYVLNQKLPNNPFTINHKESVDKFFEDYMPKPIAKTNGKIIDSSLNTSPTLDYILWNESKCFASYGGGFREHIPYEGIYAYGQCYWYWKENHLNDFISISTRIFKHLSRIDKSKNDFMSFMFIDGLDTASKDYNDEFSFEFLYKTYKETSWSFLPTFFCILDKGIIINVSNEYLDKGLFKPNLNPGLVSKNKAEWIFIKVNEGERASLFQIVYYIFLEHLRTFVVEHPKVIDYAQNNFKLELH